jgi:hypothetical protein
MFSALNPRLTRLPQQGFTQRDWVALSAICLLAVAIRASAMTLLPSVLHPSS